MRPRHKAAETNASSRAVNTAFFRFNEAAA